MKPTVLYFYCKHGCPEQDNFPAVARTLLAQILKHDPDLVPYFYQNCCESGETVLESRATIEKLLKTGLDSCKSAYIIIDGLDECGRENRKEIAQYFRNAVADLPTSEPDRLRCLFVSQDDAYSKHDFSGIPSIKIKVEDNKKDIESYCLAESEKLTSDSRYSYHLARERASEIAKIVANSSSGNNPSLPVDIVDLLTFAIGMFLLAKLIWMEIFGQTSIAGLEEELEPDVFPTQISVA